jgi:hypothetical protein
MRKSLLFFLTLLAIVPAPGAARSEIPPARLPDLATVWLGGPTYPTVEYFRLELDRSGKGFLVAQFLPENPPRLYKVSISRLRGYDIELDVRAVDSDAQPIFLRGHATRHALKLGLRWTEHGRKREIFLEREDRVLGRIQAVTGRASDFCHRE